MKISHILGAISLASSSLITSQLAHAANEVKLLAARGYWCHSSACNSVSNLRGTIEVKNLGFAKQIDVVYENAGGEWDSMPATYVGQSTAGKEIWSFSKDTFHHDFAISYQVNGQTYWDNNDGLNYNVDDISENFTARNFELNDTPVWIGDKEQWWGAGRFGDVVKGHLWLKDISFNKTVDIVYTDDNWATVKTAAATYIEDYSTGVEMWSFAFPVELNADDNDIEFAVRYIHDQGEDWDNNFGSNYQIVNDKISR